MSIPEYVQGYPLDNSSLGSSKVQIRSNLDGTFLTLGTDHFNNNGENGAQTGIAPGTHAQCQLYNTPGGNGTIPAGLVGNGFETLYSSAITQGTTPVTTGELCFVRGASPTGIQLTGPGNPVKIVRVGGSFAGQSFLPGGLSIKFGYMEFPGSAIGTYNVLYSTFSLNDFPTICISAFGSYQTISGINISNSCYIVYGTPITTGFSIYNGTSPTSGFCWASIGY